MKLILNCPRAHAITYTKKMFIINIVPKCLANKWQLWLFHNFNIHFNSCKIEELYSYNTYSSASVTHTVFFCMLNEEKSGNVRVKGQEGYERQDLEQLRTGQHMRLRLVHYWCFVDHQLPWRMQIRSCGVASKWWWMSHGKEDATVAEMGGSFFFLLSFSFSHSATTSRIKDGNSFDGPLIVQQGV